MKTALPFVNIITDTLLTDENKKTAVFQTKGPLGHDLLVLSCDRMNPRHLAVLAKDDQVLMTSALHVTHNQHASPLVDFLRAAFITAFWQSPEHRAYVHGKDPKRARQEWSELMRDCNSLGYWLGGCVPMHASDDADLREQHYVIPRHLRKVVGTLSHDCYDITDAEIRFMVPRVNQRGTVGIKALGENLEHLMTGADYGKDAMNARAYIEQSFGYQHVVGNDVYAFRGRNILPVDADPYAIVFDEDTSFVLQRIHKGKAPAFLVHKQRRQEHRPVGNVIPFYKFSSSEENQD